MAKNKKPQAYSTGTPAFWNSLGALIANPPHPPQPKQIATQQTPTHTDPPPLDSAPLIELIAAKTTNYNNGMDARSPRPCAASCAGQRSYTASGGSYSGVGLDTLNT